MLYFLAILPAALLLIFIWRKDKIEKEPFGLLVKLFLLGALSTVSAAIIGIILTNVLNMFLPQESILYILIENFLAVALIEEGGKYFMLKKSTWNHTAFNYTFDAVVYAVTVSLGFATLENILYLVDGSVHLAIMRGILSVPGHAINAVFMGMYYGLAKRYSVAGDNENTEKNLRMALIVPMLTHGFYDFVLSMGTNFWLGIFAIYEIVITIFAFRTVVRLSKEDLPIGPVIPPMTPPAFVQGMGFPQQGMTGFPQQGGTGFPQQGSTGFNGQIPPRSSGVPGQPPAAPGNPYDPSNWNKF